MIHVLYLDDEEHNLTAFRAAFRRDFHVHVTTVPSEAVRMLEEHPIDVVISDQKMPDISGVEFFEMIMADHPDPVRMLLTGPAAIDAVLDAIIKGLGTCLRCGMPWLKFGTPVNLNRCCHMGPVNRGPKRWDAPSAGLKTPSRISDLF